MGGRFSSVVIAFRNAVAVEQESKGPPCGTLPLSLGRLGRGREHRFQNERQQILSSALAVTLPERPAPPSRGCFSHHFHSRVLVCFLPVWEVRTGGPWREQTHVLARPARHPCSPDAAFQNRDPDINRDHPPLHSSVHLGISEITVFVDLLSAASASDPRFLRWWAVPGVLVLAPTTFAAISVSASRNGRRGAGVTRGMRVKCRIHCHQ